LKTERPPNFRTLPLEGVIRLGPGERFALTKDMLPNPPVEKWREAMKSLRGEFLAATFEVENSLVLIWLADRFSTIDPVYGGIPFLKAETEFRKKTLGQKWSFVRQILEREITSAGASLICDLDELVTIRNLLAHQPCWIHPIWDPAAIDPTTSKPGLTTAFCAYIANETHVWSVDGPQHEEWVALMKRCFQLAKIPAQIVSKRSLPDRKHDIGGFPIGIILPPNDPLGNEGRIDVIAQTIVPVELGTQA
jgi:hypothetical protein